MQKYVMALDQGTTSSRAIIFDQGQRVVGMAQKEYRQIYPKSGYVEHDPMEIMSSQISVMNEVMSSCGITAHQLAAIGVTNQRETTIVWEKSTGRPVFNAIVWQCRRSSDICEELKSRGLEDYVRNSTGLLIDAYFSATKIKWILDNVPDARKKAEAGELLFGTVDTWLVWNLTNGKVHVTDYTNASRTMLYNIKELCWDEKLLRELDIPASMLPRVANSSEVYGFAEIDGVKVPISGIAGDQQAALFGQACFEKGQAKNTYGTGCFLLMNTGHDMYISKNGLLTTIAIGLDGKVEYAQEGSIFIGGAVIQWLRDELHLIDDAKDSCYFAQKAGDNGGVYIVPAFTGLGAPHWDMYARGCIVGLTRGSRREHIIRAAEESIAYQTADLISAIESDTGIKLAHLKVDGGACRDNFLMQFQADILGRPVLRSAISETTALGAAFLAGMAVGFWNSRDEIREGWTLGKQFEPSMETEERARLLWGWQKAVDRSKGWDDKELD